MTTTCEHIKDLLIDYADGAASDADAERVERHLTSCEECRTELDLLNRSLQNAQSIWHESVRLCPNISTSARPRRRRWTPVAAAAAGSAAVFVLSLCLDFSPAPRVVRPLQTHNSQEALASGHRIESKETDAIDIDAIIRREERSARLATSIRFLASVPEVRQDRERAEKYLRDVYGSNADAPYHN